MRQWVSQAFHLSALFESDATLALVKSAATQAPRESRVPGIDIIRGLCIIAVVMHHINLRIRFNQSALGHTIGPAANRALFWSGYYGVIVFFVISGFLITGWSLRRWASLNKIDLRQFYAMRFARIVPCLAALLLLLAVADWLRIPNFIINTQHTSLGRALLAAATFHVNWLEAHTGYLPAGWDVLWSLSVEEVFYLGFPLLCTLLRKQVAVCAVLVSFIVIGPFARVMTHNQLWADYGYLSCMDGIAFGCLAAIICSKVNLSPRSNLALRLAGMALCLLIIVFRGTAARIGFYKIGLDVTVLEIATALLLIAMQQRFENGLSVSRWWSAPPRWFGRNSYEVYLTHMLVVWPMVMLFFHFRFSINTAAFWFLGMTGLSGLAGYAVSRFYSEPLNLTLRFKLTPQKTEVHSLQAASS